VTNGTAARDVGIIPIIRASSADVVVPVLKHYCTRDSRGSKSRLTVPKAIDAIGAVAKRLPASCSSGGGP